MSLNTTKKSQIQANMGNEAALIKRMVMELADTPPQLTVDNYREIFVRLTAKDVLRCGTVCKAWRSITTDPDFLAYHARCQQTEVLLYKYLYREFPSNEHCIVDIVLDALLVSGDEARQHRLIRYPNQTRDWLLIASSHGVLLFGKGEGLYLLCNPLTRKWADLPRLPQAQRRGMIDNKEYAFYFHKPSHEYRLLCCRNWWSANGTWCVLSTGETQPRYIDTPHAEAAGITRLVPGLRMTVTTPVSLHGRLHWPPYQGALSDHTSMVVFDMTSETFSQMQGPPTTTGSLVKLFDMDGLLVGADFGKENHIDLWFPESYGTAARWELRHQVAIPWGHYNAGRILKPIDLLSVAAAGDSNGNVMLGNRYGLVVYNVKRRETVKTINTLVTDDFVVSRHMFRANLVQHPHFAMRPSADLPYVHF
ncbi:hypothetical protein EJB05_22814, partial [Eragrostis curvula]